MFCKNCGGQLTGTENVCPACGAPVIKEENNQVAEPVMEPVMTPVAEPTITPVVQENQVAEPVMEPVMTPVIEQTPVVEPAPVIETPTVVEPAPVPTITPAQPEVVVPQQPVIAQPTQEPTAEIQTAATAPTKDEKPKDNKTIILIIALVIVAVIAVILYFALFATTGTASSSGNNGGEPVNVAKENTETYAGYTFTIPDGFTAKIDEKYGLVISDATTAFSIQIDYSHKYDEYKTTLTTMYPDQAKDMVVKVEGREYLALILTDTDGSKGTEYITKADDTTTFIGMVIRSDYTAPTTIEFTKLTEILASAKQGTTAFTPGDDSDVGKSGEKIYTFTKDKYKFNEKED